MSTTEPYSRNSSRSSRSTNFGGVTTRASTAREAWSAASDVNHAYPRYNNVFGDFSVLVHDALSSHGTQSTSSSTTTLHDNDYQERVTEYTEVEELQYPPSPNPSSGLASADSGKKKLLKNSSTYVTPESGIFTERSGYSIFSNEDTPENFTPENDIPLKEIDLKRTNTDEASVKSIKIIEDEKTEEEDDKETASTAICSSTFKPYSNFVFGWLSVVSLVVLYNMWSIPIRAAFKSDVQTPYQYAWWSLDALADVIYAIDAVVKFRTEVYLNGMYHKDFSMLNSIHVRDWSTLLDVLSVVPTDFFYIMINENPLLRLNRCLRFYRMTRFSLQVESRLQHRVSYFWRFLASCHLPLFLFHCNACLYYSLSAVRGFGSLMSSWAFPDPVTYSNYATVHMKYTYSFYRSLQLMNFVGGQTTPEEHWQFSYSILCVVLGMATMALFIGYAIKDIVNGNMSKLNFETEMKNARCVLKENGVSKEIKDHFDEYYKHAWLRSNYVGSKTEVSPDKYLPVSLTDDITADRNINYLKQVKLMKEQDPVQQNIDYKLASKHYLPRQTVKQYNDSDTIAVVKSGQINVVRGKDTVIRSLHIGDIFECPPDEIEQSRQNGSIKNESDSNDLIKYDVDSDEPIKYVSADFSEILLVDRSLMTKMKAS